MSEKQERFLPQDDIMVNGQRQFYDSQIRFNGVYIASKSKFSDKSPVHPKQLEEIIPPGWCIETWKDNNLVEILDPATMIGMGDLFRRTGTFVIENIPGAFADENAGCMRYPETSIAVIRSRRERK